MMVQISFKSDINNKLLFYCQITIYLPSSVALKIKFESIKVNNLINS